MDADSFAGDAPREQGDPKERLMEDKLLNSRSCKRHGDTFRQRGEFVKACIEYSAALYIDPDYADAYLARAEALLDLGEDEKAEADFAIAKELGFRLLE